MHCTHCFRTRTNVLEDLCKDCSRYYKTTKSKNNTLNFQAVQRNHESCVRKLLEAGADVNFIDLDGHSPLLRCLYNWNIIKLLVEAGADVNYSHPVLRLTGPWQICTSLNRFINAWYLNPTRLNNYIRIPQW